MSSEHPLLSTWKSQRREVIRRIARDPERFWYWEIRLRIFDYLISRYSDRPASPPPNFHTDRPAAAPSSDFPAMSLSVARAHRIRTLLERIHSNVQATHN